jgi:hypothetical protein
MLPFLAQLAFKTITGNKHEKKPTETEVIDVSTLKNFSLINYNHRHQVD